MVDIETFIGRQREIAMVEAMVFDPQQRRHILPVLGPGGVGKTWLLRALYREFQQHPDVLVIRTEFAEVRSASLPTLAFNVFKQFSDYISQEERDEFQERLANWELEVKQDAASIGATIAEESIYLFGFGLIMRLLSASTPSRRTSPTASLWWWAAPRRRPAPSAPATPTSTWAGRCTRFTSWSPSA
jgi:hypothetical protein